MFCSFFSYALQQLQIFTILVNINAKKKLYNNLAQIQCKVLMTYIFYKVSSLKHVLKTCLFLTLSDTKPASSLFTEKERKER